MCMALYVAAEIVLPRVPWVEAAPAFNTQELAGHEDVVRERFSKTNVVFLGAHTGCSCGFSYGELDPETPEEKEDDRRSRESVRHLREYLADALKSTPELEIFACWEGDQSQPETARRVVSVDHFGGEAFGLNEHEMLVLRRDAL